MPEETTLASIGSDNVKVDRLVRAFLEQQSLKVLPQTQFGDAVTQFVDKDDKRSMQNFVTESLDSQVKQLLARGEDDDEDLADAMDMIRLQQEAAFAAGTLKRAKGSDKVKPRPKHWDSDEHGAWEDQPGAVELHNSEDEIPAPAPKRRGRAAALTIPSDEDDDAASVISAVPPRKTAAAKKVAPAKKAPAKKTAPAKAPARGRKKVVAEPSDDEDDFEMIDAPPPPKSQPKRAAAAAATTRGRQTQLTFSQQPKGKKTTVEISDDEISDDDNAFAPASQPAKRR